jgi:hypothetical protein
MESFGFEFPSAADERHGGIEHRQAWLELLIWAIPFYLDGQERMRPGIFDLVIDSKL